MAVSWTPVPVRSQTVITSGDGLRQAVRSVEIRAGDDCRIKLILILRIGTHGGYVLTG
jgi:hypothetical protein